MKKWKKISVMMLACVVALTALILPLSAEEATGEQETAAVIPTIETPTADYVGYSSARVEDVDTSTIPNINSVAEVDQLMGDFYKITDAAGLIKINEFLQNYATFLDITIYLANDIDMSTVTDFEPIGFKATMGPNNPTEGFKGTFDGLGHMINNLKITVTESNPSAGDNTAAMGGAALFYSLSNATVKNLIIGDGCEFNYASGNSGDHGCTAGIAVLATNVTIDNCINMANCVNQSRFTGGIVARLFGRSEIRNCTNAGILRGCQNVAGIVAYSSSNVTIENCRNIGKLVCSEKLDANDTLVGSDHSTAGIIAWARSAATVTGCINNGEIVGYDNAAGIVGQIGNDPAFTPVSEFVMVLKNNTNYGAVSLNDPAKFKYNNGDICSPTLSLDKVYAECNVSNLTDENNVAAIGETDASLGLEVFVPDYTPEADPLATTPVTDAPTEAPPDAPTAAPTAAPTEAPTNAPTNAPATDAPADDAEEGGCFATVIGGVSVILLVSAAAVTLLKKKEN